MVERIAWLFSEDNVGFIHSFWGKKLSMTQALEIGKDFNTSRCNVVISCVGEFR